MTRPAVRAVLTLLAASEPIQILSARPGPDDVIWMNVGDPDTPRTIVEAVGRGWEVYNAPRPMLGTENVQGPFRHGIYYGLIDPSDEFAERFRESNLDLDGWPVKLTSNDEILGELRRYVAENYPDDPSIGEEMEEVIAGGNEREIALYTSMLNKPWAARTSLHRDAAELEFERNEEGSYDGDMPDFETALKKPEPVEVAEMDEPFEVETLEGWVEGKPGDVLVRGPGGEMWPIDKDVFADTYVQPDELDDAEKSDLVKQLERALGTDEESTSV